MGQALKLRWGCCRDVLDLLVDGLGRVCASADRARSRTGDPDWCTSAGFSWESRPCRVCYCAATRLRLLWLDFEYTNLARALSLRQSVADADCSWKGGLLTTNTTVEGDLASARGCRLLLVLIGRCTDRGSVRVRLWQTQKSASMAGVAAARSSRVSRAACTTCSTA